MGSMAVQGLAMVSMGEDHESSTSGEKRQYLMGIGGANNLLNLPAMTVPDSRWIPGVPRHTAKQGVFRSSSMMAQ